MSLHSPSRYVSDCSIPQRHAWLPYFDDINALIFLAPISCFDERLAEDRRVNRLQDSILLWKAVCGSKLLQNVQLILVRNFASFPCGAYTQSVLTLIV